MSQGHGKVPRAILAPFPDSRILGLAFVVPPIVLLFGGTVLMVGAIGAASIWLLSIVFALSIVAKVARLLEAPPNSAVVTMAR
jgi:hypothetical protein